MTEATAENTTLAVYQNASLSAEGQITEWTDNTSNDLLLRGCNIDHYYHNHWYPYYYPTYISGIPPEKSKVEQAFKIVNILFKKKLIKVEKVKEFVDLVDEISKVL